MFYIAKVYFVFFIKSWNAKIIKEVKKRKTGFSKPKKEDTL